ncbi:sugar O-acetyltransferase [Sphingobacterium spiritivorum]|uniref:Acetyltransferase n=1 Tax=Sphingobacterium spiritivorum ATCC 33861 TaxID=525373 RepID=D7VK61_SPHSI|nr:sugar O-acetyltransferase [Sphingobacterium spiritivorum]EFK58663.1 bacterial transferase hexapeptide repeat protein [Sphingobacterium spiritivorum ATCC 33861]QQT34438.1 sugar O-acetyltransferase [Sphingobacterium spiritivorum]WQD35290.1 sugar O-acetyltransferase [Sphingobacterium spiritivorum]SUI99895.1 Putative acetyltransferase SA2342 [Sphingobacterium spiritivorum]
MNYLRYINILKMTEKDKMLNGELYDCGDKELLERWHTAKRLQKDYNQTDTTDSESLDEILKKLLGSRGKNVWIAAPFFVDYGENIHIGNNVEINMNCIFLDGNRITIGDNSGIGPGVHIYTVNHPVRGFERLSYVKGNKFPFWKSFTKPVTIGNNVWIGGGSIILPGVTIGDNTTVGAGSVVTKDIPSQSIAVGNPCRVIQQI